MLRSINAKENDVTIKVTRVQGNLRLIAPVNYQASVLIKLVAIDSVKHLRLYALWVMAGRDEADAVAVDFAYTGEDVLRIDVPDGAPFSLDHMNKALREWKDPTLPPQTPVIKGST